MYVRTVRIENSTIHTYNYVRTEVNDGFNIIFLPKKICSAYSAYGDRHLSQ